MKKFGKKKKTFGNKKKKMMRWVDRIQPPRMILSQGELKQYLSFSRADGEMPYMGFIVRNINDGTFFDIFCGIHSGSFDAKNLKMGKPDYFVAFGHFSSGELVYDGEAYGVTMDFLYSLSNLDTKNFEFLYAELHLKDEPIRRQFIWRNNKLHIHPSFQGKNPKDVSFVHEEVGEDSAFKKYSEEYLLPDVVCNKEWFPETTGTGYSWHYSDRKDLLKAPEEEIPVSSLEEKMKVLSNRSLIINSVYRDEFMKMKRGEFYSIPREVKGTCEFIAERSQTLIRLISERKKEIQMNDPEYKKNQMAKAMSRRKRDSSW